MEPSSDLLLARMQALHPKIIDLTLDRVWRLLATTGNPQDHLPPVIHVAGTNGKGSTLAMIRAGLEGAGDLCHVYTSPHLARFHERIRLSGTLIDEGALTKLLDDCLAANGPDAITYFEITTVAALLAFSRTPADWTLLEVGLGGRLDATNVIKTPALTVITPVAMDHESYLGDTLQKIAYEKAGILKRGVPCVVAPQDDAALAVIEVQAARVGAPLLIHGQHWHVTEEAGRLVYQDDHGLLDLPRSVLPGPHQIQNAGTALAALRALGLPDAMRESAYDAAMTKVDWPARMQRLRHGPLVDSAPGAELWLDGGHNPAAGLAIAETLDGLPKRPTHLICGMLNTKDIGGFLRPLSRHATTLSAVAIPDAPATLPAEDTARHATDAGFTAQTAASVAEALAIITAKDPSARVLICGSLYLAGDVLKQNG